MTVESEYDKQVKELHEDDELVAPEAVYVRLNAESEPVEVAEELVGLGRKGDVVAVYTMVTVGRKA